MGAPPSWQNGSRGGDAPFFFNGDKEGLAQVSDTVFFQKSLKLFAFDFGEGDDGRSISYDIGTRMWPSLALALPTFILGLFLDIVCALLVVLFRYSVVDRVAGVIAIMMMSISGLFYIIIGQYLFGYILRWFPISGYEDGIGALRFILLPLVIGVIHGIPVGIRVYRTVFIEEMEKDYVRTARSKGIPEYRVLGHVLQNGLLPILTGVVVVIPQLFMGSLIMESFFGIPGLGSYTIDAIQAQDFSILRSMVFLGSVLYILGVLLTDLAYCIADPRVRLG